MVITLRKPSRASMPPSAAITAISLNWPMVIAGPIWLSPRPRCEKNGGVWRK